MTSIFTKIINKEIPSEIIWENDSYIAFMDAFPVSDGHILVCPKKEIDYIFDLDSDIYHGLWDVVKMLEELLRKAMNVKRVVLQVEGFLVPHTHVHMIPLNEAQELKSSGQADMDKLKAIADSIRAEL